MLTAEFVRVKRSGDELKLVKLAPKDRERALLLAEDFLGIAQACVGETRDDVEEQLDAIIVEAQVQKIAGGLRKLLEDRSTYEGADGATSVELRREVFLASATAWRALPRGQKFDRDAVLDRVAASRKLDRTELERRLYSDLRGAEVLRAVSCASARVLVDAYDAEAAQAVLLRATKLVAVIQCASPATTRHLFRKLKFQRLLFTIHDLSESGYKLAIDGPLGLFESSTKYGLGLALLLPALEACDSWELAAQVRWGKAGTPLTFRLKGALQPRTAEGAKPRTRLPDDVATLVKAIKGIDTPWRVKPAESLVKVKGAGVLVPDLVFTHAETGARIQMEVMGFWSRDAVWKRVELVERGLSERFLFAVSQRLRVSAEVLPDDAPASLYVYKGVMNPRAVIRQLDALAAR